MKRRKFIGIAAAGAAGLVLPGARGEVSVESALARPRLLAILRDEEAVRALGRRYRANLPAENESRALAEAIAGDVATGPGIDERVQRDFAEGRTVTLNGWVLAVTEARQCALFSLLRA